MTDIMIGMVIGLAIGWNILPQPAWVADLYERWLGIVKVVKDADAQNK